MKVKKFKLLAAILFFVFNVNAADPPPPQPASIPPPVGAEAPIDSNIDVLFLIGITLGLFFISRRISQKE
ncbi:hypothetical protein Q1W71_07445 [Flavobacterium pectinovorum]|uniref:hypothetical protein n=1 Tax=Flavobacterium pectinovorum TaxID=29533 RepID=UPI00265DA192|nr:hypothetical protein [Flavobacterium pectinovorum]WKL49615.1 hypothetical protein Q1W71_07445 [Flavobacterium pectinovorum]